MYSAAVTTPSPLPKMATYTLLASTTTGSSGWATRNHEAAANWSMRSRAPTFTVCGYARPCWYRCRAWCWCLAFHLMRAPLSRQGGLHHSVALSEDGRVFAWGRGDYGQTGLVHTDDDKIPVGACSHVPLQLPPSAFGGAPIRLLETGSSHSVAVTDDSKVYTWGYVEVAVPGPCWAAA